MADDDLAFAGLARHADLIAAGELSSRELVELFLARIARYDPVLNAYRVVFAERALAEADQADGRRRAGEHRPLLGVPVAIKDDCDVAGEVTAFGSDAADGPARADAEVVRRLRSAGAVVLGKTHVPELAITPFTESPTYGVTRNPWDLQRTSGGSSGGSATAVAAGLASAALGSDGAGSIRIPAACCGLFGLKPQRGRVPTAHESRGMSVWGPLTRTVEDWARVADAIKDGGPEFAGALAAPAGRLRIAVSTGAPPGSGVRPDAEQLGGVARVADVLRELGHEVTERELDWGPSTGLRAVVRYLKGIADRGRGMPHADRLSRRTRGYVRMGAAIPEGVAVAAERAAKEDAARLGAVYGEGFDAVLTPVFTRRPPRVREYEGRSAAWTLAGSVRLVPYLAPFNHTGQPAASVPAGFAPDGFPLGVQLVAPEDGEPVLLALAAQLQQATGWPEHRPAGAP